MKSPELRAEIRERKAVRKGQRPCEVCGRPAVTWHQGRKVCANHARALTPAEALHRSKKG